MSGLSTLDTKKMLFLIIVNNLNIKMDCQTSRDIRIVRGHLLLCNGFVRERKTEY